MQKLTRFEMRWADAAFGTIFPAVPELGFPVGICDMGLEEFVNESRRTLPALSALGVRFAIWFMAFAPVFVLGRFSTLAGLSVADRERVLNRLAASPIYFVRQMVLILKATGALLYGGDPRIRARCLGGPQGSALASGPMPGTPLVALRTKPREAAA